jgi:hypothetical protein
VPTHIEARILEPVRGGGEDGGEVERSEVERWR